MLLGDWVHPNCGRISVGKSLHPGGASLFVHMFDATAWVSDLVRTHCRIANENDFIVVTVFMKNIPGFCALLPPPAVVLPNSFIKAIVKVKELEVLEFTRSGAEKLFRNLYERIHRPANIQK